LENNVSSGDFYDWQKSSHGYEQMAIWRWTGYNMSSSGGELPEFLNAGTCSWNLLATLGSVLRWDDRSYQTTITSEQGQRRFSLGASSSDGSTPIPRFWAKRFTSTARPIR